MIMKRKIKALVNKYSKRVEKQTIGCGLTCYDTEDLEKDVCDIVDSLVTYAVGYHGTSSIDSQEYEDWYKKQLVFDIIAKTIGKRYGHYTSNLCTPTRLQTYYGPRD